MQAAPLAPVCTCGATGYGIVSVIMYGGAVSMPLFIVLVLEKHTLYFVLILGGMSTWQFRRRRLPPPCGYTSFIKKKKIILKRMYLFYLLIVGIVVGGMSTWPFGAAGCRSHVVMSL